MRQDEVDKLCEGRLVSTRGGPRSLIEGIGVNDLPHVINIEADRKQRLHSGYRQWRNMLKRVYSTKFQEKYPTYVGVTVCAEWLKASNFIDWYKQQRKEEGWQLDKDLLSIGSKGLLSTNNKVYSPETCIFIPSWLNSFTTDSGSARGECLIGVYWHKQASKFMAQCCNPITGKQGYLGLYNSEAEAHNAWKSRKLELALELKPKMDDIDIRLYPNVVRIVEVAS